jgi:hypothetical protein
VSVCSVCILYMCSVGVRSECMLGG